jgi:hypothetical protein
MIGRISWTFPPRPEKPSAAYKYLPWVGVIGLSTVLYRYVGMIWLSVIPVKLLGP